MVVQLIALLGLMLLSTSGPANAQTYDVLAMKNGASYGLVRFSDNALNACSSVPTGDTVAKNGKKVTWSGVGTIQKWRQTCQRIADNTKRQIRDLHPMRLAELEREMDRESSKMEADARAVVRKMMTDMQDERVGCFALSEAIAQAAEKNCKP